jgi:hypothetical protein
MRLASKTSMGGNSLLADPATIAAEIHAAAS